MHKGIIREYDRQRRQYHTEKAQVRTHVKKHLLRNIFIKQFSLESVKYTCKKKYFQKKKSLLTSKKANQQTTLSKCNSRILVEKPQKTP